QIRRRESQLHHGDEAHSAGERFSAASDPAECVFKIGGRGIFKTLRDHGRAPSRTSFQIFSDVRGISICRTPSGFSAFTTELTTGGEQPIAPASPTPLTPSGFTGEGVSVWLVSICGTMVALGTA